MSKIECPYCDQLINEPTDCYEEDEPIEHQCPLCDKIFIFYISYTKHFNVQKADCLNDGKHVYIKTITYPQKFTKLVCEMCGDTK